MPYKSSSHQAKPFASLRVQVPAGAEVLEGDLSVPERARGIVLFAHGSGSSRHSPRNRHVAQVLQEAGVGTLLFDLLTAREESIDQRSGEFRFDIELLSQRLLEATEWMAEQPQAEELMFGYFGASTGAAAALVASAQQPPRLAAVVSRGGRPDLASSSLPLVKVPTLLIVGGDDSLVLQMNRWALAQLSCEKRLSVVSGATHLFAEPGALDRVARLASGWFAEHLPRPANSPRERAAG
jgi:putative phosphoribosyl transferase